MSTTLLARVNGLREQREQAGTRRQLQSFAAIDPRQVIDQGGEKLLSFASNDYLGLRLDPRVSAALAEGARRFGAGAGASHLLGGQHEQHVALAEELAAWTGQESAILFASGYCAAIGTLPALLGRHDHAVHDRLNHACLLDGTLLARARLSRYPHLDWRAAERLLREQSADRASILVSDSVFSMDGDQASVPELDSLAQRCDALLLLDEAHALGVMGPQGGGLARAHQLKSAHLLVMGTLGKALGTAGAFVAGAKVWVQHLQEHARSFIYSTAPPPALAFATRSALHIAQRESARREHLEQLITRLQRGLQELKLAALASSSPIQPIWLGDSQQALHAACFLRERGIYAPAIRPPTVPDGSARLRISLSAAHQGSDVDRLLQALRDWQLSCAARSDPSPHAGR